jgi:hypothetical protein
MKSPKLSIGKRVALVFAVLLFLGAALDGYLIYQMRQNATKAKFIADAVVTQCEIISTLSNDAGKFRLNIRSYALSGDASYRDVGLQLVPAIKEGITKALKLSEAYPELTVLKENAPNLDKAFDAFVTQCQATDTNLTARAKLHESLNTSGTTFDNAINRYIDFQEKKMAGELAEEAPVAKITERYRKLNGSNDIADMGSAIRLILANAELTKDPFLMDKALALLPNVVAATTQLLASTQNEDNRKALADVLEKTKDYRLDIEALQKNYTEAKAISNARIAAGDAFQAVLDTLNAASNKRANTNAKAQSEGVVATSSTSILGLIALVVGGVVLLVLVNRGISHVPEANADSPSQGAPQIAPNSSGPVDASDSALAESTRKQAASADGLHSSIKELASMNKRNAENDQVGKNTPL